MLLYIYQLPIEFPSMIVWMADLIGLYKISANSEWPKICSSLSLIFYYIMVCICLINFCFILHIVGVSDGVLSYTIPFIWCSCPSLNLIWRRWVLLFRGQIVAWLSNFFPLSIHFSFVNQGNQVRIALCHIFQGYFKHLSMISVLICLKRENNILTLFTLWRICQSPLFCTQRNSLF